MTRLAAWLGVGLVLAVVVWLLAPVLAPFVIAAVLAYVLHPLVLQLEGLAGQRLPRAVAVAIAGPVEGDLIRFTNNPWIIRPTLLGAHLGVERQTLFALVSAWLKHPQRDTAIPFVALGYIFQGRIFP
jgi:hypothetical protein